MKLFQAWLAQFSLYVHKGGLKPDSFHFYFKHGTTIHYHWPIKHMKNRILSKGAVVCSILKKIVYLDNMIIHYGKKYNME